MSGLEQLLEEGISLDSISSLKDVVDLALERKILLGRRERYLLDHFGIPMTLKKEETGAGETLITIQAEGSYEREMPVITGRMAIVRRDNVYHIVRKDLSVAQFPPAQK